MQYEEPIIGLANKRLDDDNKLSLDHTWQTPLDAFQRTELEPLVQELLAKGDVRDMAEYCAYVDDRTDLKQAIVQSKDPFAALDYARYVRADESMAEIVLSSGVGVAAAKYCAHVNDSPEMRQVVLESGNGLAALAYLEHRNSKPVFQALVQSGDHVQLARYCADVYNSPVARNIILHSEDPKALYLYCEAYPEDILMGKKLSDTKDVEYCSKYLKRIGDNPFIESVVNPSTNSAGDNKRTEAQSLER